MSLSQLKTKAKVCQRGFLVRLCIMKQPIDIGLIHDEVMFTFEYLTVFDLRRSYEMIWLFYMIAELPCIMTKSLVINELMFYCDISAFI